MPDIRGKGPWQETVGCGLTSLEQREVGSIGMRTLHR